MEKFDKTKKSSNSNPSSSRPFFNKNGEGSLFFQPKETDTPFFSPNTIQAKLTIGQPNDKYEQEADALADRVGRGETGLINNASHGPNVQSMCADCSEKEENVQRSATDEGKTQYDDNTGTTALISQLNSSKGSGHTITGATEEFMSEAFGTDFGHVHVHTDARAADMNQTLNARAFTHGSDIYFNHGQYDPGSADGKKLLAHELVHTVQQGQAGRSVPNKQSPRQQLKRGNAWGLSGEELARSQVNTPQIQRSTNWAAGSVHETINSATQILFGAPNPITWEMLNGTMLKSHALASGAIKAPTISTSKAGKSWKAKVTGVPLNEGSFDETVYAQGPWTRVVPKATVNSEYGIGACRGAGNTTFRSKGVPDDNVVYQANRRHEDHHANDHQAAFNAVVKSWDTKVTTAKNKGTEYIGASAADAEANLWAAMGGTPAAIAINFNDECGTRGTAYHGTAKGGPIAVTGTGSDKTCTNSWAFIKNPS